MLYAIYFIYGLCVMFYFMMSWLFYRKDKEMLSRLVTVLMFVVGLQCLKDLFFIKPITELDRLDGCDGCRHGSRAALCLRAHRAMQPYEPHTPHNHIS